MHLYYPRLTEEQIGSDAPTDLVVWLFFQIAAGHVALPILIATFLFARTVPSNPAVVTVCITWVLSGVFSTLLFYVGQHTGPEPSQGLCVAQASLLGAIPILTCSALLILAFHVWRSYDGRDVSVLPELLRQRIVKHAIVAIPFIAFGIFVAIGANLALQHSWRVSRERRYFYCSLDWAPFSTAVAVISTLLCLAAVVLLIHVAIGSIRYWRILREGDHLTNENLSLVLRTAVFTAFLLASTFVNLLSIWVSMGVFPDMFSASVGMALFFIFVSQPVILRAWAFWHSTPSDNAPPSRINRHTSTTNFTPAPQRRYRPYRGRTAASGSLGSIPSSSASTTLESATSMKDYYGSKGTGKGVQIIGRPDEAFKNVRIQPDKPRTTISTWGF